MPTHLYIQRHRPVSEDELRRFELLLAVTQAAGFQESMDSLEFPVSEIPISDDYRLTATHILGKLPADAVCFWATEKAGAPGQKDEPFLHRHWVVSERNCVKFKPERIREGHSKLLLGIAQTAGATHIGIFQNRRVPTLFTPDERIVWTRPDGAWDVCSLDGELIETVPAAA